MSKAEIDEDARQRVKGLLGGMAAAPSSPVQLPEPRIDPAEVAASIRADLVMRHVHALAASPRPTTTDHDSGMTAAAYIEGELGALGLASERLEVSHQDVALPVVFTTIRGTTQAQPRTVVLLAHYDTVEDSPGADDNASGVAGLLEIARVLPHGTLTGDVVLAAVPFEENPGGFAGSRRFAAHLDSLSVDVVAAISAEMIGYATDAPRIEGDDGDDLFLIGFPGTADVIGRLLAAAAAWSPGKTRGLTVPRHVAEVTRSDHASFAPYGIPAVMATDGAEFRNPHYHQPSDLPASLDPEFLRTSTASLAVGLIALAS